MGGVGFVLSYLSFRGISRKTPASEAVGSFKRDLLTLPYNELCSKPLLKVISDISTKM
jgi:hypothetical protein